MKNKNKGIAPLIAIIIIAIVVLVGGGAVYYYYVVPKMQQQNTQNQPDQTAGWKTYTDQHYGFSFNYPSSLKIDVQGPNIAQQDLNTGKTISGTVTPSYETLYFRDSANKAKFQIDVFHTTDKALTVDNYKNYFYTSGTCDLRYLEAQPSIEIIQKNGISLIQVDVVGAGNLPRSCFYLKNKSSNLIVFSMLAPNDQSDYESTKETIEGVLSTFEFTHLTDSYDCITGSVNQELSTAFLTGKTYTFFCASGEWGIFESNEKIIVNHGVSQGESSISPIVAKWEVKNGELTIYNSANNQSIGSAKNFKFFSFSGDIFAASEGIGCSSMIIGPDLDKNGQFFQNKFMVEECQ